MDPVCIQYRIYNISHLARNFRSDVKSLCQWMCAAIEAIGVKMATISAVMSDPTLSGKCANNTQLKEINTLREKNHKIRTKIENAYGIYSNVDNMKNKVAYDQQIALQELQPSKYSNEDQLNMTSSVQTETKEDSLSAELCQGGIEIEQLKPWNHLELSDNKVEPKKIKVKKACNKFGKIIETIAGFESAMNLERGTNQQTTQTK